MDTDYDRIAERYTNQKLLNVYDSQRPEVLVMRADTGAVGAGGRD